MDVDFLDLKKVYQELKQEFDQLWYEINSDSFYIMGSKLSKFEQEFAEYLGVKHLIGVGDGLDALVLSLRALDIKMGDEVIVPAHTFIASWLAISETGAIPVPVEVDSKTCLIDQSQIERAVTKKTKAIMPVHLYGRVCDMQQIRAIADRYNLKIIEDSAQSHGAVDLTSGKKAGSFGDCSGFSFYPGKNLGCFGDGGCISTNDSALAEKIRLLRNYGSPVRYEHKIKGVNSRLDELQAGVLSIKLKHLDSWNEKRRLVAQLYLSELACIDDLILPEYDSGHVWHIFAIRTVRRDELKEFLGLNGVGTIIHYPKPIHMQEAYKDMNIKQGSFLNTEKICASVLSLPMHPYLQEKEVMYCAKIIKKFFAYSKSPNPM